MLHTDLIIGPAQSGKSALVLQEYAARVQAEGAESVLLLLPTHRIIQRVKYRLLTDFGLPALLGAHICTFPDFSDQLLSENAQTIRPISSTAQHLLIREIVNRLAEENRLPHFSAISDYPGFISAVLDFIVELKRGAVEPEDFLRLAGSKEFSDDRTKELADLYARYQEKLNAWNLFDAEGRFWWARNLLRQGNWRPFENVRLLLVDGFSDWTPTQWDVLLHLVERCESAMFTLTLENLENTKRFELFLPTDRVRRKFEEAFPHAPVVYVDRHPPEDPILSRLSGSLFAPAEPPDPAKDHEGPGSPSVHLLSAPGKSQEVEAIARQVKQLLLEGVPPAEVGVVFRNLDEYGDLTRRTFAEFGIPAYVSKGISLNQEPLVRTIYAMLSIPLNDYRREDVLQFFNSNYVSLRDFAEENLTLKELDRATRESVITRGKEEWVRKLEALRNRTLAAARAETSGHFSEEEEGPARHDDKLAQAAEKSLRFFRRLTAAFGVLRERATFAEYLQCLRDLCRQFLFRRDETPQTGFPHEDSERVLRNREAHTWRQFVESTEELLQRATRHPEFNPLTSFRSFVNDLRVLLGHVTLPPGPWTEDRVAVLDVHEARELSFEYLFIGGLAEKEFPRMARESAFFSDAERKLLNEKGINLEQRLPQQRDEAFLFYLAVTRARRRLYLSYPSANATGDKILPSCYLGEVQQQLPRVALSASRERLSEVTHPLARVCHVRELTERVLHQLWLPGDRLSETRPDVEGAYNLLARHCQGEGGPNLLQFVRAVEVESRRNSRNPPDVFDGMLREEPNIVEDLRSLFPPERRFSASQLRTYGSCPFRFFASRIVKAEPREEPSEYLHPVDRGEVYHSIARRFLEKLRELTKTTRVTETTLATARTVMTAAIQATFEEKSNDVLTPESPLWRIEQHLCEEIMDRFLTRELELSGKEHTADQFEYAYGMQQEDSPLVVRSGDHEVLIRGRIDRVDLVGESGFAVFDYKTGYAATSKEMNAGADLQLPIYAMAAQAFLFAGESRTCSEWAYYKLNRNVEFAAKATREKLSVDELIAQAKTFIINHVKHMREGRFQVEPVGNVCSSCRLQPLCRVEPWRLREKSATRERERRAG